MKIEKIYKITKQDELIYAKSDLKNFFRRNSFKNVDFFLFALMELGTNILKYAKAGEIWILSEDGDYLLAALDKGSGIENLEWAIKKGTSSKNTLGLGLYQLSQFESYKLEIFTSTKDITGTIVLVRPKKENNIVYLTRNYLDMPYGGDFVVKKGKYLIVGDVSGHGKRAHQSAEVIKSYFLNNLFSCLLIDEFLQGLDKKIKEENLRGVVLSILEVTKFGINICGIGTNKIFVKKGDIEFVSFKEGIIGEAFSSTSKFSFKDFNQIFVTTDGIDEKLMYNILQKTDSLYLSILAGIFYSKDLDDKTILGVQNGL